MFSIDPKAIADFCQRWLATELAVFGSHAQGKARSDSDIDLLISFAPQAQWSLLDHAKMEEELSQLLGKHVDLVTKRSIERSHNPIRKQSILENQLLIYAQK